ncbi:hypothetical protein L0337_06800 [candidate division KSB1 bacterium]|nr:hypothetical protein [candidate division KSB1 bacterium]
MNREIIVQLPEDVFNGAINLAQVSGFAIDELMAKLVRVVVKPAHTAHQNRALVQRLFALFPDDEILALANLKMDSAKLVLFNQLLAAQQEKELSAGDAANLEALGLHYDKINLVKSYAMLEAVRRNLRLASEPT